MTEDIYFTVFTPVYNRKHTIHRVWDSLNAQTCKCFEWIVIDDGSEDGVWELLQEYKRKSTFPVILKRQENMGKHIAWNRAVKTARGKLFVPADSDDSFVPETIERFLYHWNNSIPKEQKEDFSGINVLCRDPRTKQVIGDKFPQDVFISNNLELHFKYKIRGEKWGCVRTDVLRKRPFKEVKGSFLSENWIWFYIARRYKVLCVNEALRNYYTDDSICLSKPTTRDLLKSAESHYTSTLWNLADNFDYIWKYESFIYVLKRFLNLHRYAFYLRRSTIDTLRGLKQGPQRLLYTITVIPGIIAYLMTFYREKDK